MNLKLNYDPKTGEFRRKNGVLAGSMRGDGYLEISFNYKRYRADRLAWFCVHGELPWKVEHKDGDKKNNAIDNLAAIERQEKESKEREYKNKTGFRGVSQLTDKFGQVKYGARLYRNGQSQFLGYFDNPLAAHRAYCAKAEKTPIGNRKPRRRTIRNI